MTMFDTTLQEASDAALQQSYGITQNVFNNINNGTIININLDPDINRHTDDDLAKALITAAPELKERIRFSPDDAKSGNCNGMYYCDNNCNVWTQRHNVVLESLIVKKFADIDITDADRRHVQSRRGRNDILYCIADEVIDESFKSRSKGKPRVCLCGGVGGECNGAAGIMKTHEKHDHIRYNLEKPIKWSRHQPQMGAAMLIATTIHTSCYTWHGRMMGVFGNSDMLLRAERV
jgi:hypothetical protein